METKNLDIGTNTLIGSDESSDADFILENKCVGEGKVVLVVDDDAVMLPLISALLETISFKVVTAESAEEAIALLNDGVVPDLLLTDINMSGIDGFELAVKVKEVKPNIGIVYMSGFDHSIDRSYNVAVKAELLVKPFKLSALCYALSNAPTLIL